MAFITAETISKLLVPLLERTIVLPATVSQIPSGDYVGSGGTTKVRIPQRRAANLYTGSLTYGSISEDEVEIEVTRWWDAVNVTTAQATLDLVSFTNQVLEPMVTSVSEAGENVLAAAMDGVTPAFDWTDLTDPDSTLADLLKIRETLTSNKVPAGDRFVACAPDVVTALLSIPTFVRANESGDTTALDEAIISRKFGLTFVESSAIEAGSAVAYHRSGFALATFSPTLPYGGADSSVTSDSGITLRTVLAYISSTGDNGVLVDTYGGATAVDADNRVVRVVAGS
jgi:hypothetical protein